MFVDDQGILRVGSKGMPTLIGSCLQDSGSYLLYGSSVDHNKRHGHITHQWILAVMYTQAHAWRTLALVQAKIVIIVTSDAGRSCGIVKPLVRQLRSLLTDTVGQCLGVDAVFSNLFRDSGSRSAAVMTLPRGTGFFSATDPPAATLFQDHAFASGRRCQWELINP
ncbi:hypothetical protein K474DRAFT_1672076 [Panus rudis PR-1116 ss-1]|nr:hypothetical protein K474DRAFT_1672076 [Panus rudis PR-1116 ss-1]